PLLYKERCRDLLCLSNIFKIRWLGCGRKGKDNFANGQIIRGFFPVFRVTLPFCRAGTRPTMLARNEGNTPHDQYGGRFLFSLFKE
ncbi:MAG: hypothetical protein SPI18_05520, partial [Prevotella sp.]|nr:hypothetical protein [Prevotella sp.]